MSSINPYNSYYSPMTSPSIMNTTFALGKRPHDNSSVLSGRLIIKHNGEVKLIPKSPAEVFGERVLLPTINKICKVAKEIDKAFTFISAAKAGSIERNCPKGWRLTSETKEGAMTLSCRKESDREKLESLQEVIEFKMDRNRNAGYLGVVIAIVGAVGAWFSCGCTDCGNDETKNGIETLQRDLRTLSDNYAKINKGVKTLSDNYAKINKDVKTLLDTNKFVSIKQDMQRNPS